VDNCVDVGVVCCFGMMSLRRWQLIKAVRVWGGTMGGLRYEAVMVVGEIARCWFVMLQ